MHIDIYYVSIHGKNSELKNKFKIVNVWGWSNSGQILLLWRQVQFINYDKQYFMITLNVYLANKVYKMETVSAKQ